MRSLVLVITLMVGMPSAFAALVCREKSTGRVLETQEFGVAGTCLKNYVTDNPQYGFQAKDIEELLVSDQEAETNLKTWMNDPTNPDMIKRQQLKNAKQVKTDKIKVKLGLSDKDMEDLREVLEQ